MDIKVVEEAKPLVNVNNKENEFTEKEKENLFMKLLLGEDATSEVETSRGVFTIKYPKEKDKLEIGRLMSINRGGLPVASFDSDTEGRNIICSTLNILVVDTPDWFKKAKKKKPNITFEEVPDEKFLLELYQKVQDFRNKVQKSFESGGAGAERVPSGESLANDVSDGIFDGVESSSLKDA